MFRGKRSSDTPMTTGITYTSNSHIRSIFILNYSRCLGGSISVRHYIHVNDNNNALSIVGNFSVISAPLDKGPNEVQFQLVPQFSHAFFLSTHLWILPTICWIFAKFTVFGKHLQFFKNRELSRWTFLSSHLNFVQTFNVLFTNMPFCQNLTPS